MYLTQNCFIQVSRETTRNPKTNPPKPTTTTQFQKSKNLLHADYFYQLNPNSLQNHARAIIVEKGPFILSLHQKLHKC